ncbi:hypothetical protein [Streptomyces litmocidini]|uniref:Uncharacterized protein n=1 Tax=Streptomyces litmocidini TaxID=67318 RepID=A0ABW7UCZ9_9ACTN
MPNPVNGVDVTRLCTGAVQWLLITRSGTPDLSVLGRRCVLFSLSPALIGRDRDAVIVGLILPCDSGAVGGHVNRIEMLERQLFGSAGFALPRDRVLLARRGHAAFHGRNGWRCP